MCSGGMGRACPSWALLPGSGQPCAWSPGSGQPCALSPGSGRPCALSPVSVRPCAWSPVSGQPCALSPGSGRPSWPASTRASHMVSTRDNEKVAHAVSSIRDTSTQTGVHITINNTDIFVCSPWFFLSGCLFAIASASFNTLITLNFILSFSVLLF